MFLKIEKLISTIINLLIRKHYRLDSVCKHGEKIQQ